MDLRLMKLQLFYRPRLLGIAAFMLMCTLGTVEANVSSAQAVLTSEYKLTSHYVAPSTSAHWYGWQTLTADLASLGLTALGVYVAADGAGSSAGWGILVAGLISYTAVTPLLHLVHGNLWMFGSLLLRGAVIATTIAGTINLVRCIADNPCWGDVSVPLFLGGPALAVVTTVLDTIFAVERRRTSSLSWVPWADTRSAAGGLTLIGRW
jgi:hypothetical protein